MAYFSTSDHTEIFYNDWGHGDPVVLIHGWPLSSAMWEYQAQALVEEGYRVIAYDRRGFGKSSQPFQGYDYNTLACDLHDLIVHLNLHEATLVGFSMGGGEVARYLTLYGANRIKGAVLVSSVVPFLLETNDNPTGVNETLFSEIVRDIKEDRPKFLADFAQNFYGMGFMKLQVSDETLQWTSYLAYQASPKATTDCVHSFSHTDFRPDLKSFTVPTLIIHGRDDKTVPIGPTSDEAARAIKGAIYRVYDDAPHGLFVTHKRELFEDLFGFLKRKS